MLTNVSKDRLLLERAKDVATSSSLAPSSEEIWPDLPPSIGQISVRLVSQWRIPRIKLQPSWEEEEGCSTD